MIGFVYNKYRHRNMPVDYNPRQDMTEDERKKVMNAIRFAKLEADEKERQEHRHGYCPHCFMLIPMSGKCPCQN